MKPNTIYNQTMKKALVILFLPLISLNSLGQDKAGAEKLVNEGIELHDKGDFAKAISKYNKALELDKDNLLALAEKAMTSLSLNKPEDAVTCCEKAIETHPNDNQLKNIYVTYGNAYDALKKTEEAVGVYDDGIKLFPNYYQLYFNKGISLIRLKNYDESMECFQKAVQLNPKHASSHNAIARLVSIEKKNIPAILAYCRFFSLEQTSNRASENLVILTNLMKGGAQKTGKNSISITLNTDDLGDTTADGKNKANNFSTVEMILSLSGAIDLDNKKKSEVEVFISKMETLCSVLEESKEKNSGFFWEYYAPYLIEMKNKKMIEPFAYITFASSSDPSVSKWLKSHKGETAQFALWSEGFVW
jgi:tetratricopeptide (TPR) repeat protein